jgi:hypothetical protein
MFEPERESINDKDRSEEARRGESYLTGTFSAFLQEKGRGG